MTAPSLVQSNVASATSASITATYTSAQVFGDTNVVVVTDNGFTAPTSVTDTSGNTYTEIGFVQFSSTWTVSVWVATRIAAAAASANTVTVTYAGSILTRVSILEYTPSLPQLLGTSTGSTTNPSWTTTTTRSATTVLAAFCGNGSSTPSAGSGWTSRDANSNASFTTLTEDQVVATAGSVTVTGTGVGGTLGSWASLAIGLYMASRWPASTNRLWRAQASDRLGASNLYRHVLVDDPASDVANDGFWGITSATVLARAAIAAGLVATRAFSTAMAGATGFCTTGGSVATPASVQAATDSDNLTTFTVNLSSNATVGNVLIVAVGWVFSSTIVSLVDNVGNTYNPIVTRQNGGNAYGALYAADITIAGANAVTVTMGASTTDIGLAIVEYSGLAGSTQTDGSAFAGAASSSLTTISSGNFTTTAAGDLIYGMTGFVTNNVTGAGSGFTLRTLLADNTWTVAEDKIGSSAGTYAATFGATTGSDWVVIGCAWKAKLALAAGTVSVVRAVQKATRGTSALTEAVLVARALLEGVSGAGTFTPTLTTTGTNVTLAAAIAAAATESDALSVARQLSDAVSARSVATDALVVGRHATLAVAGAGTPFAGHGGGSPTPVQGNSGFGTTTAYTLTLGAAATVGNVLVVGAGWFTSGTSIVSITDNVGNTYNVTVAALTMGHSSGAVYAADIQIAGATSITVTMTGSTTDIGLAVVEYSGLAGATHTDGSSSAGATSSPLTTLSSGNFTTTVPGDLIYGFCGFVGNNVTGAGSGFTLRTTIPGDVWAVAEDMIGANPAGTYAATCTTTAGGDWTVFGVAFKPAPPPPGELAVVRAVQKSTVGSVVMVDAMTVARTLLEGVVGTSILTADVSTGGAAVSLAASIVGVGSEASSLAIARALADVVAGGASVGALPLRVGRGESSAIAASSAASASFRASRPLAESLRGSAAMAATAVRSIPLVEAFTGSTPVAARFAATRPIALAAGGHAILTDPLSVRRGWTLGALGLSTLTDLLGIHRGLVTAFDGDGAVGLTPLRVARAALAAIIGQVHFASAFTATRPLAEALVARSVLAETLAVTRPLQDVVSAAAAMAVALTRSRPFADVVLGTSALASFLRATRPLVIASAGASSVAASSRVTRGETLGVGARVVLAVPASVARRESLAVASVAAIVAPLSPNRGQVTSIAGSASVATLPVRVARTLVEALATAATLSLAATLGRPLAWTADGAADLIADLDVEGSARAFAAAIAGAALAAAAIAASRPLALAALGLGSLDGSLGRLRPAAAAIAASAAATAAPLAIHRALLEALRGQAVTAWTIRASRTLSESVAAAASLAFADKVARKFALPVSGDAQLEAPLGVGRGHHLTTNGTAAVSDTLRVARALSEVIVLASAFDAALTIQSGKQLAAALMATADLDASLNLAVPLASVVDGFASLAALLGEHRPLLTASHGSASTSFPSAVRRGETMVVDGESSVVASLLWTRGMRDAIGAGASFGSTSIRVQRPLAEALVAAAAMTASARETRPLHATAVGAAAAAFPAAVRRSASFSASATSAIGVTPHWLRGLAGTINGLAAVGIAAPRVSRSAAIAVQTATRLVAPLVRAAPFGLSVEASAWIVTALISVIVPRSPLTSVSRIVRLESTSQLTDALVSVSKLLSERSSSEAVSLVSVSTRTRER